MTASGRLTLAQTNKNMLERLEKFLAGFYKTTIALVTPSLLSDIEAPDYSGH